MLHFFFAGSDRADSPVASGRDGPEKAIVRSGGIHRRFVAPGDRVVAAFVAESISVETPLIAGPSMLETSNFRLRATRSKNKSLSS